MTSINVENRIVEIKTVQSNAIRILFEALKDILTDVNLQISQDGLKIISMDGSKQAIVNLKLEANKFERFYCSKSMLAGLNMTSLYKIIKSIKNSDIITFYILENSSTKLHIEIENKEKKTKILTVLKLLDIDEDILDIPNIAFETVKTMPSNDFQSYIRELSIITNKVTLESNNNTFSLSGEGDFAETKINIGDSNSGEEIETNHHAIGTFYIKYLLLFTKSTNLCTTVEIYLKNKYPLILVYNVANLGKLQYCLAPLVDTL
jgi:proliferating cell nuclear antigen